MWIPGRATAPSGDVRGEGVRCNSGRSAPATAQLPDDRPPRHARTPGRWRGLSSASTPGATPASRTPPPAPPAERTDESSPESDTEPNPGRRAPPDPGASLDRSALSDGQPNRDGGWAGRRATLTRRDGAARPAIGADREDSPGHRRRPPARSLPHPADRLAPDPRSGPNRASRSAGRDPSQTARPRRSRVLITDVMGTPPQKWGSAPARCGLYRGARRSAQTRPRGTSPLRPSGARHPVPASGGLLGRARRSFFCQSNVSL